MRQTDMKLLYPNQEIEFSDEQVTSDTYRIHVRLDQDQGRFLDPASYVEQKWVEKQPNDYTLRIKNITGSPVYVSVEDANA
ncbi:hypothetical protein DNHGIG_36320 [Collibacillus ludicampi]|uniref:Uncharacterized protein n=1 Tax=Collibacillus ludicampi TaxID=2771369 RepID=A0AAV4LJT3_9BACL|nr:hypothetical protein [Collibacillus ludicampi]GIM48083.1 hypothetical protein DNHGIG_36320 [Collibacillus ludicampi]